MKNNGLTLKKIKSTTKTNITIDSLDNIKDYVKEKSFVVAYLDNEVLFGKYENGVFDFFENKVIKINFLKRLRVFNQVEELHIWKKNGKMIGRYRKDGEGEDVDVIESNQVIFGTDFEYLDGYTLLKEQRGTNLVLPGKWEANNNSKRVAVRTRHYIEYINGYQASYCDSRLVDFVQLPLNGGE